MSAFSELLTNYVAKSGLTKNGLIEACQVNRSTFFQCLNGKRLPKESFFEHLLSDTSTVPGGGVQAAEAVPHRPDLRVRVSKPACAKKCLRPWPPCPGI